MTQFHTLTIKEIRRETPDCISIAFAVPPNLAALYRFEQGQNITLRVPFGGEEIRRSYSICASPLDNELRVAVKKVPEGKFSFHAVQHLKPGDAVDVLPPSGKFNVPLDSRLARNYLALAAGSGITPVISIIRTTLMTEPGSQFTLVYGNRDRTSIIFRDKLDALKNCYMDRLTIHHVLSREKTDMAVYQGRIDAAKCEELSAGLIDFTGMDHIFLCGPEPMIFSVRDWLLGRGVPPSKVHFELFHVPGQQSAAGKHHEVKGRASGSSRVSLRIDGSFVEFPLDFDGPSVLDAALRHGADLPFACKGGVCATCKARLLEGRVHMEHNYALEADELEAGFILTCQSHPTSERVVIDFDAK